MIFNIEIVIPVMIRSINMNQVEMSPLHIDDIIIIYIDR